MTSRRAPALLVAAVLPALLWQVLGTGATAPAVQPRPGQAPTPAVRVSGVAMNPFDAQFLALVNLERAKVGAPPLRAHNALNAAAEAQAQRMATSRGLTHDAFVSEHANAAHCRWTAVGEDVQFIWWWATPEQALTTYRGSPPHWENLMNPAFRDVGIGSVDGNDSFGPGRSLYQSVQFAGGCPDRGARSTPLTGLKQESATITAGRSTTLAGFATPDPHAGALRRGPGVLTRGLAWHRHHADGRLRVTLRLGAGRPSTESYAGLQVRRGVDLGAATSLTVRVGATATGRSRVPVVVRVWDTHGTPRVVGVVRASRVMTAYTIRLPAGARHYVNHLEVGVRGSLLLDLPGRRSARAVTLDLSAVRAAG